MGLQLGKNLNFRPLGSSNISTLFFSFYLGQGELKYLKSVRFGVFLSFPWGKQVLGFGKSETFPCESARF